MPEEIELVEIVVRDETGQIGYTLIWKKGSREVCLRFARASIAKASFKTLGRAEGVDEEIWQSLGI